MTKRLGAYTVALTNPPSIVAEAAIAGKKEGEGPLGKYFDFILDDSFFGEKTWEKAESKLLATAVRKAVEKSAVPLSSINYIFAGDLLNQCVGSHYAMRDFPCSFFGLYGACSTMAESLSLAAMTIDGGFANYALAATSSHFCSAEKQFRLPLEYGGQRAPTAQWTVTGAGSLVLSAVGAGPYITHITTGRILDMGIKNESNMGAAMAPAAVDTMYQHFQDTSFGPQDYDMIVTGDLGIVGKSILIEMMSDKGYDVSNVYNDCGCMIFSPQQDVQAGASGCGCSAITLAGNLMSLMRKGKINNLLFMATGALMSPVTSQQGESIPAIAHGVRISNMR